ncbi:MAG TPA: glycosyltransferase [Gammaproteobacteria bacterium]
MRFSVIVPTFQRRELMLACVRSLTRQDLAQDFEVIVVVDGSTDGSAEALRELRSSVPLVVIEQGNLGLSAARNAGAKVARGELLLFLDDDMEADPHLLAEHDREHRDKRALVLGHIPLHPTSPRTFLSEAVGVWANERLDRMTRTDVSLLWRDWVMGQSSIPRTLFFGLGCFDETFTRDGRYGNEDLEFCYRVIRAGAQIVFNAKAISWQAYVVSPRAHLKQWLESGAADVHFVRKHPELAEEVFRQGRRRRWLASLAYRPLRWLSLVVIDMFGETRFAQRLFFAARALCYARGVEAAGGVPRPRPVHILCYHAIADLSGSVSEPYGVRPERFRAQIGALQRHGYHFISAGEFLRFLSNGAGLPKRALLLTFDDCYQSLHDAALPVLRDLGVPAVAFAVSGKIGASNDWDAHLGAPTLALADSAALGKLERSGIAIGSHSRTHRNLTKLSDDELWREVNQPPQELRSKGLAPLALFAYPYGEHDQRTRNAVQIAGFEAAVTTEPGIVGVDQNRYRLPRVEVMAGDSVWRLRLRLCRQRLLASLARRLGKRPQTRPRVTVIVPAFNAEGTLGATLASVCAQTFSAWEALVVDDGSTDATGQIANAWSDGDPRFRTLRRENGGESAARNTGIAAALGEWLVFLDSDDWIAPEYLERMIEKASADRSLDGVVCGCARVTPAGVFTANAVYGAADLKDPFPKFVRDCPLAIHNCMIKLSIATRIGGFDETLQTCADWDFWQRAARIGVRFGTIADVLALYRMRPGSSSSNASRVLADGLSVIRRGYAKDPRVPEACPPQYSDGLTRDDLGETLFRHALWPASMQIVRGENAAALLDSLIGISAPGMAPELVGDELFHDIPLAAGETLRVWPKRFSTLEPGIAVFLSALESASGAVGLAEAASRHLERRILESIEFPDRVVLGTSLGVRVEVTRPIAAIEFAPGPRQAVVIVTERGHRVGTVAIPVSSTPLEPARVTDAVVEHLAWPIIRNYLGLQFPPDSKISLELRALTQQSGVLSLLCRLPRFCYSLLKWQKASGVLTNRVILKDTLSTLMQLKPLLLAWRLCRAVPGERKTLVIDAITRISKERVRKQFSALVTHL